MLGILNKKQRGDAAEEKALGFLQIQGLRLLMRNFRSPFGEIDLIMQDQEEIVFVEVRSRERSYFGTAIESIDKTKQQKIIKSATCYLQKRGWSDKANCRFDVIGLSSTNIEWIKDAFTDEQYN